jgi:hypothetical protein
MAKVKIVLNWCIPMVLITVALMTPVTAQAGSIKIWADQLKPSVPSFGGSPVGYMQDFAEVRNGYFFAPLKLPLGVRITKVTYYHRAFPGASTSAWIQRVKMGDYPEVVANGDSIDDSGEIIPVDLVFFGDRIIRPGYRYIVQIFSSNDLSFVSGVIINYLP